MTEDAKGHSATVPKIANRNPAYSSQSQTRNPTDACNLSSVLNRNRHVGLTVQTLHFDSRNGTYRSTNFFRIPREVTDLNLLKTR
ncbi:hypothetical protein E2C01_083029 [Portunus trituberculatus]|uniref:Uncharacterized protein n=1 Tax=Portunus trituberculatus TaxID=210409 RepID=A0A5B7J2D1_PORTR|nr:hypothetical protein [Portunus trituberculatus]